MHESIALTGAMVAGQKTDLGHLRFRWPVMKPAA